MREPSLAITVALVSKAGVAMFRAVSLALAVTALYSASVTALTTPRTKAVAFVEKLGGIGDPRREGTGKPVITVNL